MIEYPAMIYKINRNNVYVANCMVKNLIGFGKTEEDALNNLKESLQNNANSHAEESDISIIPLHGLSMVQ